MDSIYLVPTRGRPVNAVRLAMQWPETVTAGTRLMFCLDDDDPLLPLYKKAFLDPSLDNNVFGYSIAPRMRLGGTLNYYAPKVAAGSYDAVGFMGDDHLPRTLGWDKLLQDQLVRGGVVYGDDTIQHANLPTAVLLDARLIRSLGFMVPPGLVHMYMDNFWRDLGRRLGTLRYVPQAIIEHLHPLAGKAEWDARYDEVNAGAVYAADEAFYTAYMQSSFWQTKLGRLEHDLAVAP
jgi:hypothetical protein